MKIQVFESGVFATNTMALVCEETSQAAIIDPAKDCSSVVIDYLSENNFQPIMILLTHSHWDHMGDVASLKKHFNVPVAVHSKDGANLEKPGSDGIPLMFSIESVKAEKLLADGDIIKVGNLELKVIHTPGHSPGSVCFWCEKEKVLISGDTLFKGSIGNISFPTSNPNDMWKSLKKLKELPPETKVCPGHMGTTTLGEEPWLDNAERMFS